MLLSQALVRLSELDPAAFSWATIRSKGLPERQALLLTAHSESIRVIDPDGETFEELDLLETEVLVLTCQLLEYVAARPLRCLTWATLNATQPQPRLTHSAQIWPDGETPKTLERSGRSLVHALVAALIACLEMYGPLQAS